jgi:2-amino-4-hydroxy-6-hydroxymethyldihydropteridine diphosphokinase
MSQSFSVCIGLGSNLGDSLHILQDAWQHLGGQEGISLQALSPPYRTKPVGMESEHWFINAAGLLTTVLAPEALLDQLLATEHEFGRRRNPELQGYQDRTLDLDLLLYGELILSTSRLHIPHPELHNRLFVLEPLAELIPDQFHPQLCCTIKTLRRQLRCREGNFGLEQMCWPGTSGL